MPDVPTRDAERGRLPQFHIVGFTGHRRLEDDAPAAASLAAALTELRRLASGEWVAVSSAAAGSDLLFARRVLESGMAWHVLLPLAQESFRHDFSAEEWREAEALLARAESVTALAETTSREEAYLDCGIETVDACDVLIAVWDGEPARGRGGTAEMVTYARELDKPLLIIDPDSGQRRRENFGQFQAIDPEIAFLNGLPDAAGRALSGADAHSTIENLFHKADAAANRSAPQFRRLTVATVLLHIAATIVATAGLAFDWHPILLPWTKLLFVLGALAAALAIRYYGAQHNWVRCRLAAEIGRAALATWGMPRRSALFEDLDLPGARQLVRSLHLLHERSASPEHADLEAFRQDYRRQRIENQLDYYRAQLERAAPLLRGLRLGFTISTVLAVLFMLAYALHHSLHLPPLPGPFEAVAFHFLPIVLPVIAAAFLALVSINDLHRRVARYREMCHLLEGTSRQIMLTHSWRSLEQLVRRTERSLLREVLEWHTLTRHLEPH